jgi:hypothetical protein
VHQQYVLRLSAPEVHLSLTLPSGIDPIVTALAVSGWRLWLTGWPDQAVDHAVRAQAHAEALAYPLSLAEALLYSALVRQGRGEFPAALALAQCLTDVGREYGFVFYEAMGTMLQGGCGCMTACRTVACPCSLRGWRSIAASAVSPPSFSPFWPRPTSNVGKSRQAWL